MLKTEETKQPKALNPMLLLVCMILIIALLSYIIPAGVYDRVMDEKLGKELVDPNSFHYVEKNPITLFGLLMSITLGIQNAAYIISFLLIIGGMFAILNATGAINTGMANVVRSMKGRELLMIPVCMIVFGCGSAFCANFEEFLAFVPLVLACCYAMGFDSLTAVGIIFCAAASGYAGAITNAFTTGVAQSIAGLPMFSGMGLRIPLFISLITVSILYVMYHAHKVKKNPESSSVYQNDLEQKKHININTENVEKLTGRQKAVLATLILGIAYTVYCVIKKGYYIDELSGIFLAIGIIGGFIGGLKPSKMCDEFLQGCINMLFPCIMIGLANSVVIILKDAFILDTIIHGLASLLNGLPASIAAIGMFIVQDLFNIVVPSGSGQAAITMPIMAPLADMIGITRQTAVLAFQLGDAFTNVMAPTGGEILAALAMCGTISFKTWMKYLAPLFVIWWLVSFVFLTIATQIQYGPF